MLRVLWIVLYWLLAIVWLVLEAAGVLSGR